MHHNPLKLYIHDRMGGQKGGLGCGIGTGCLRSQFEHPPIVAVDSGLSPIHRQDN